MATPIAMPKLGMTMREGKVVAWNAAVAGHVEKGAPVVVIESEKSEVEIDAAASGVLRHVYVDAGETVPCGALLGAIATGMDEPFDVDGFRREHHHPDVDSLPLPDVPPPLPEVRAPGARAAVTPAARARARELGVDLATVTATGPGGRITREDVEAASSGSSVVRLEVRALGTGNLVVCLPGFASDVSVFAPEIPELARRFRVLGVHPRGVGASSAPATSVYSVEEAAADVAALLEVPAHVVGASLGAAVAIEMALAHPERVRTLTLVTPFVEATPRLLAVVDAWCRLAAEASPETVARALVPWMFSARMLGDAGALGRTIRGLAGMLAHVPTATLARQAAGLRAWSGTRREDLARILVPTLVVGAEDDLLTPDAAAIAAAIPGARLVLVPGAGHAVALEAPDDVTAALLQHLD